MKIEKAKSITIYSTALIIIGALVGFFSTPYLSSGYKYTKNYTVSYSNLPQNADPEDYTDSTVAIIQTPEFFNKLDFEGVSVETKKIAPFVIKITTSATKEGINEYAQGKIEKQFNEDSNLLLGQNIKLNSMGQSEKESFEKLNNKVMLAVGATFGLFSALFILTITKILEI